VWERRRQIEMRRELRWVCLDILAGKEDNSSDERIEKRRERL